LELQKANHCQAPDWSSSPERTEGFAPTSRTHQKKADNGHRGSRKEDQSMHPLMMNCPAFSTQHDVDALIAEARPHHPNLTQEYRV